MTTAEIIMLVIACALGGAAVVFAFLAMLRGEPVDNFADLSE